MGNTESLDSVATTASVQFTPRTLADLGIAPLLSPQTLQCRGWTNVAGLPYFIEHPEIGLVQLVAQYRPDGAPVHTHFCVRRLNPLAQRGDSPYAGGLYTVPARAPHVVPLQVALIEFRPTDESGFGSESGPLGAPNAAQNAASNAASQGYVRFLTNGAVVYTVPWHDVQRVLTIDENEPESAKRKLQALRSSTVRTLDDVIAVKRAVRLLERSHPIEVRAWTSVTLCDADAWGDALASRCANATPLAQPLSLGGDRR